MLGSLTFPGSSLERGTLRKHLFNDRLCRIEFCGRKQRKKARQEWRQQSNNKVEVGRRRWGRARGSQVSAEVDTRPSIVRPVDQSGSDIFDRHPNKTCVALAQKYI